MKLYATISSERATKGQGGNKKLEIELTAGSTKEPCWMGTISLREFAPDKFQVFYTAPLTGKKDKSGILFEANTRGTIFQVKGEKQKGDINSYVDNMFTQEGR